MNLLLDTNVISELRKSRSGRADPNVIAWAERLDSAMLSMSVISLQELETGVLLAERRDHAQGAMLRAWLDQQVLPAFGLRILPIDRAIALRSAALHVPATRPFSDSLIAATALVHGMTVATRNVGDFAALGVPVVNPWLPITPAGTAMPRNSAPREEPQRS